MIGSFHQRCGSAFVTVNNLPVISVGQTIVSGSPTQEWKKTFSYDNTSSPVNDTLNVVAVLPGQGPGGQDIVAEDSKEVSIPQTPENLVYDSDGNLIEDGLWFYTWSGENNLISMESKSSIPDVNKKRLEFSYDSDGRRISKKVYRYENGNFLLTSEFLFYCGQGFNLLAETDASQNLKTSFVWGTDLSGSFDGAGGVGGLLWSISGSGINYYFYDFNGNVANTISSSGTVTASYEYDPFGNVISKSGSYADENTFRFSTKYLDIETGLSFYGFRYYNPETGRWVNRDPIEERGGLNVYGFVFNNTTIFVDIFGLKGGGGGIRNVPPGNRPPNDGLPRGAPPKGDPLPTGNDPSTLRSRMASAVENLTDLLAELLEFKDQLNKVQVQTMIANALSGQKGLCRYVMGQEMGPHLNCDYCCVLDIIDVPEFPSQPPARWSGKKVGTPAHGQPIGIVSMSLYVLRGSCLEHAKPEILMSPDWRRSYKTLDMTYEELFK